MVAMGQFKVEIGLYPRGSGSPQAVEALVDTGAAYTVLARSLLDALGYTAVRNQRVVLAEDAPRSGGWLRLRSSVKAAVHSRLSSWDRCQVPLFWERPPSRNSVSASIPWAAALFPSICI